MGPLPWNYDSQLAVQVLLVSEDYRTEVLMRQVHIYQPRKPSEARRHGEGEKCVEVIARVSCVLLVIHFSCVYRVNIKRNDHIREIY